MKTADFRKMPTKELASKSTELREEIVSLKRGVSLGEIENVRIVRAKRKDLARALTVLSEQLTKETQ